MHPVLPIPWIRFVRRSISRTLVCALVCAAALIVNGCSSASTSGLFAGDDGGSSGGSSSGSSGGSSGGGNSSGEGGTGPTCVPATCAGANTNCGQMLDGCGGTVACGTCAAGETCGARGPNQCGPGTCAAVTCASAGKNCGKISDGCASTLDCGSCAAGQTCGGGGGGANVCGTGACTPTTCAAQKKDCGVISDGCGGQLACGSCAAPLVCGAAGASANVCAPACPEGCPTGYTCNGAGACAGGTPNALVLDVKTVSVAGTITLNGAAATRTCTTAAPATVRFVDKAHGYDLSIPATCTDTFAFSGNVYPGTYEVSVAGTQYSNLPQGTAFIANPALVLTANAPALALDVKTVAVSGTVTLNGAAPTRTCNTAAPAIVHFFDKTQGYALDISVLCTDSFAFTGTVYPGTYAVSVAGTQYSNLPEGTPYVANAALAITTDIPALALDVKTVSVAGVITLNGAAATRTCTTAAPAIVHFADKTHGYALDIAADCTDSFSFAGTVYPGTYEVSVTGTQYSNLPQGTAYVVNSSLPITANVASLPLDVKTVSVAGTITLNGAAATRTCTTAAPAIVHFADAAHGYTLDISADCTDSFSFAGTVYPGTYAVSVVGTPYSNLPQGTAYLANAALAITANVTALALDVKTVSVAGTVTLNGAAPTRTCTTAAPAILHFADRAQGYALDIDVTCTDAFAYSGNVYPGTYAISIAGTQYSNLPQGTAYVAASAQALTVNVPALALDVKTISVAGTITLNGAAPIRTCTTAAPADVHLLDRAQGYDLTLPVTCSDTFSFFGNVYPGTYAVEVDGTQYSNLPEGTPYVVYDALQIP